MAEPRFAQGCPTSRGPEGPGRVASGWVWGAGGESNWPLPDPPLASPSRPGRGAGHSAWREPPSTISQLSRWDTWTVCKHRRRAVQGLRTTQGWEGTGKNLRDVQLSREKVRLLRSHQRLMRPRPNQLSFGTRPGWWPHSNVKAPHAPRLNALKCLILWYVDFTSVFKKWLCRNAALPGTDSFQLFNERWLSLCSVPGTDLGPRDATANKIQVQLPES